MNNQPSQHQKSQFSQAEPQVQAPPTNEGFFTAGVGLQPPDSERTDSPNLNIAGFGKPPVEKNSAPNGDDFVQPSLPPGYSVTPDSVSPISSQSQETPSAIPTIASLPGQEPNIIDFATAVRVMREQNQTGDQAA